MFYREAGQYKTSYKSDMAVFPLLQDRLGIIAILAIAFIAVPMFASEFIILSVMVPFLVFPLAAIGLNFLTGYTCLLSLGTRAFKHDVRGGGGDEIGVAGGHGDGEVARRDFTIPDGKTDRAGVGVRGNNAIGDGRNGRRR